MRIQITTTRKPRNRRSPSCWVGTPARNIPRDTTTREEPDTYRIARPLGSVHPSADVVEVRTVGLGVIGADTTAGVGGLAGGVDVAVARFQVTGETGITDRAATTGV